MCSAGIQFGRVVAAGERVIAGPSRSSCCRRSPSPYGSGNPERVALNPGNCVCAVRRRARCSCTARRGTISNLSERQRSITNISDVRRDLNPEGQRRQFRTSDCVASTERTSCCPGRLCEIHNRPRVPLAAGYVEKPENIVNLCGRARGRHESGELSAVRGSRRSR